MVRVCPSPVRPMAGSVQGHVKGGVCACAMGGETILKRETRMGPGPPWSPEAPPESVQRTLRAPSRQAPAGVAAGGLAWGRTSGGVGLCDLRPGAPMPGRVMQLHSRPLRGGHGGATTTTPDVTHPQLSVKTCRGGGGGSWGGGGGSAGGGGRVLAARPGGGAARYPLLPHGGGGVAYKDRPRHGVWVSPSSLEGLAPPCDGAVAANACV